MDKVFIPSMFHRAEEQNGTLYKLLYKLHVVFLRPPNPEFSRPGKN